MKIICMYTHVYIANLSSILILCHISLHPTGMNYFIAMLFYERIESVSQLWSFGLMSPYLFLSFSLWRPPPPPPPLSLSSPSFVCVCAPLSLSLSLSLSFSLSLSLNESWIVICHTCIAWCFGHSGRIVVPEVCYNLKQFNGSGEWSLILEGAMNGVTVSMSAFLACMPRVLLCWFESCVGHEFSGFSMWHFLKLIARGFLWVLWFPPLLHQLMVQLMK